MNLGLIEFQPLELDNWIKSIELIMNKVIKLTPECIKINFESKGYSINSQVNFLESIYMSKNNK